LNLAIPTQLLAIMMVSMHDAIEITTDDLVSSCAIMVKYQDTAACDGCISEGVTLELVICSADWGSYS